MIVAAGAKVREQTPSCPKSEAPKDAVAAATVRTGAKARGELP
jgi:hypothetical protein